MKTLFGIVATLALCGTTSAQVVAEHTGANDPTGGSDTTTWTETNTARVEVGADAGPPASWRVEGGSSFYSYRPTASEHEALATDGWKLSVNLRVPNAGESLDYQPYAEYSSAADQKIRYFLIFGSNADGEQIVAVNSTEPTHTLAGSTTNEFHLYELIYNPAAGHADLLVDGQEVVSDIAAVAGGHDRVLFGGNNGHGAGEGHYHLVRLETGSDKAAAAAPAKATARAAQPNVPSANPAPRVDPDPRADAAATAFFQNHPNPIDLEQQGDQILFANRKVGLAFRQTGTGIELTRLYGIEAKQDFLVAPDPAKPRDLFEVQMATDPKFHYRDETTQRVNVKITDIINRIDEIGEGFTIGSHGAKKVSWREEAGDGQSTLHLSWDGMDLKKEADALDVKVSVTLKDGDPLAYWRVSIHNPSERYGILKARLPILHLAPIGEAKANAMLYPKWRGGFVEDPFHAKRGLGENYHTTGAYYPYYTNMQFWALYNQEAHHGIYLATQDPVPHMTHFLVDNTPEEITWSVAHFPSNLAYSALDYEQPYDSVTGPFQGDWYDACQVYREWAVEQTWAAKGPLHSRDDVPKWFKEAPLMFYTVMGDSATGTNSAEKNLHIFAEDFKRWLEWADIPLPANFYGWQDSAVGMSTYDQPGSPRRTLLPESNRRRWAGFFQFTSYSGNYPALPAMEEFSEVSRELREAGGMLNPYVCLQLFDQGPLENSPFVDQAILHASRGSYGRIHTWPGLHMWFMCVASEWWQDRLVEQCVAMAENEHVGGFYLDVMHGMPIPCLWTAHGHSHGGGDSMTSGMHQISGRIRDAVQAVNPDIITTGEDSTENTIDVIDGALYQRTMRPENRYPLFGTVYNDYISRYGLEMSVGKGDDFYIEAASLFVEGSQLGRLRLRPRSPILSFDDPEHKDEIDFLGRVVGYYKQDVGKKFLAYGQLLRPLTFSAPAAMPMLGYDDANTEALTDVGVALGGAGTVSYPALFSGVFRSTDGDLGVFIVNAGDQPLEFAAELDPAQYGMSPGASVRVESVSPDGTTREAGRGAQGVVPLKGSLAGHEIVLYRIAQDR